MQNLSHPPPGHPPPSPQSWSQWRAGGRKIVLYGFPSCVARLPGPAPGPALAQLRAPWRKAAQSPGLPLPAGHRASKRALSSGGGEAGGPLEKNNTAPNSGGGNFPNALLVVKYTFNGAGVGWGEEVFENPLPSLNSSTLTPCHFLGSQKGGE